MAEEPGSTPMPFDTSVAHPARVYDVWLGGKDHFDSDEEAARLATAANPGIVPAVRANRAFLGRAVRTLAADTGIRQFLDIGTGIPTADNTHEVAQRTAPDSRVLYIDNDPTVLAHSRALLVSHPKGATGYVQADLREVPHVLAAAADRLDLSRPVALLLVAVLQYVADEEDPYGIVRRLLDALAPGSHVVISHPASDIASEEVAASMRAYNERAAERATATPRTHDGVTRFFSGTELLAPGIVQLPQWRPEPGTASPGPLPMWCGVGRVG